jgi:benzoyl-CoA reductase subunit B
MKWFELLRHEYKLPGGDAPRAVPGDGVITQNMRDYVVEQLKEKVIPALERGQRDGSSTSTSCASTW